ncbi:hypothetical protein MPH_08885 [Macrophomina phaseolina MS6]|uniref:Uncharacterized protein n=1 Tax=Macrophomina phaseolina (strain MS6) TaxID=1126212 RepID=K2QW35_MACPH|nr:hypothetical protein MPH_08885 [Macrophomina phaseolina MS6]
MCVMFSNGKVQISLPKPRFATFTTERQVKGATRRTTKVITASSQPRVPPNWGNRDTMRRM